MKFFWPKFPTQISLAIRPGTFNFFDKVGRWSGPPNMIINKIVLNGTYTELYNENLNYELITVVRAQQRQQWPRCEQWTVYGTDIWTDIPRVIMDGPPPQSSSQTKLGIFAKIYQNVRQRALSDLCEQKRTSPMTPLKNHNVWITS